MFELRFYRNNGDYEVLGRYHTAALAFGMRKKKAELSWYPIQALKVVKQE